MYKAGDVVVNRRGDVVVLEKNKHFSRPDVFPLFYVVQGQMVLLYACEDLIGRCNRFRTTENDIVGYAPEEKRNVMDEPTVKNTPQNPLHYTRLNPEPIDVIQAWNLSFDLGNVVKYIVRAGHKGNRLEDLEKALVYLQHEIKKEKSNG